MSRRDPHRARPASSRSATEMQRRLIELEAGERYTRERYELYRAKVYGPRATSQGQLRDLQQAWRLADMRLRLAQSTKQPDASNGNRASR